MIDGNQVGFQDKIYESSGGSSAIYLGTYSPLDADGGKQDKPVAIKELRLPKDSSSFLSGVMQEVIIQTKLESCEYVCKFYGYFLKDNCVYIVMERLSHNLDQDMRSRNGQPYPEPQLTSWMYHILEALQFAQEKNIAHRDIKPQNILVNYDRKVKLVDFGSGTITVGKVEKLTGTPLYMSPEQQMYLQEFQRTGCLPEVKMNPYKGDVYSLGVTFLQLALLEPPIGLLTNREPALQEYLGKVSQNYPTLSNCLYYMLLNNPRDRCDIPQLIQYINNPSNSVIMTLSQPTAVPQEQTWYCQYCSVQLAAENSVYFNEVYMCQSCYYTYYQTPVQPTPSGMPETEQPAQPPPVEPEFSNPLHEDICECTNCSARNSVQPQGKGDLRWFCSTCFSPNKITA